VPANVDAVRTAVEFGIDLGLHRATRASDFQATPRDLLVGFEPSHLESLEAISGTAVGSQITLLGAWSRPPNLYIHDPYGTRIEYFRACFRRVERAVERLVDQIESHGKRGGQ